MISAGEFIATAITPFSDTETNYIQEFQWHPTRPLFLIESEEQVELWKIDQNKITKIFNWQPTREDEFIERMLFESTSKFYRRSDLYF